ncbi:hypothetical protein QOZ80_2AG0126790 [Eleusine coracana subsp. coracana]|uniref:GATA-type domain-containing protein n=1 Tax=Eleusine coracana subsp. coracana TaxID=191504 RepID=A0AAV9FXY1_ELECO|nr:hypothetical protein QOZ80_UnG0725710 [Eleusine coracana subsp. coracana]KAK3157706.1 hypothetical protein QOZ80_2AG0126790 [Eleusine coracana subsp. coracana]
MVVVDAAHGDFAAAADELFTGGAAADLQTFFDHTALEVKAGGGGLKEEEEGEEEEELEWLSNKDAFPAVETMAPAGGARPRKNGVRRRRCLHCGADRTPQWREGPEGPGTLCNACGVRYRAVGRLAPDYRPLSSPTFCPELHSNRHRRVIEMRRPREEGGSAKEKAFAGGREPGPAADEGLAAASAGGVVEPLAAAAAVSSGNPPVGPSPSSPWPKAGTASAGQCRHCGTEETPQWRQGPDGPRTLCTAGGMQFRAAGRLVPEYRPLRSPTFSPELHSNIRRNVAEMCRRREDLAKAIPAAATSEK